MNAKIERVCKEIDKTKVKINEQQTRLRELEKQKIELENIEIVDAVRGMNINFVELAELLKATKDRSSVTSGQVGPMSAAVTGTETKVKTKTETKAEDISMKEDDE